MHWSDDDLLARLYGVKEADAHVAACAECAARWDELQRRRAAGLTLPRLDPDLLAEQRRTVYARLESRANRAARWTLAPALAGLALVGVALMREPHVEPAPAPVSAYANMSDADLFQDVYTEVRREEPQAVAPVQALFQGEK